MFWALSARGRASHGRCMPWIKDIYMERKAAKRHQEICQKSIYVCQGFLVGQFPLGFSYKHCFSKLQLLLLSYFSYSNS